MGRPNQSAARRAELLPVVAATFAELGYRRTTTAELAARCGTQETPLYRLWPDKRAMFTAAIDYVVEHSKAVWTQALCERGTARTTAEAVLGYEAVHFGELGLYRILFAGLSETDDGEIQRALKDAYRDFHRFLLDLIGEHRVSRPPAKGTLPNPEQAAWALIGLGTVLSLTRELDLLPANARGALLAAVGKQLLG